jgi:hypothetical protein
VCHALGELFPSRHFIAKAMELRFVAAFVGVSDLTRQGGRFCRSAGRTARVLRFLSPALVRCSAERGGWG